MKINIVTPDGAKDSILERLATILAEQTGWTINNKPLHNHDLNYAITYIDWAQRFTDWKGTPWAAYFSHYEEGTPYKEYWWQQAEQGCKFATVTARQYGDGLKIPAIYTPAPVDPVFKPEDRKPNPRPLIGISGFVDRSGRKGEKLLAQLASDLDGEADFIASGKGWPVATKPHKITELPAFYNSLDLYVCTSLIEGVPMPPLEALACGIPVVIPQGVGMLDDLPILPGIYRYTRGDPASLLSAASDALRADNVDRQALVNAVSGYTPQAYAQAHARGFFDYLSMPAKPNKRESARHGKRGVYYVAFGEPARKCAIGAIESFKANLPDIEVAFAGDTPLSNGFFGVTGNDKEEHAGVIRNLEDVFIPVDDTDIGGREAKVRIYDLAPKDWQYVCYLDADTEIIKGETFLWDLLEDGWDMVICINPDRFSVATNMKRSDNIDECNETYQRIGSDEVLQLNGGVFAFQRNNRTKAFFKAWHEEWRRYGKRDQAALLRALWANPLKLYVIGNEWNTITRYISQDRAAWLLHYPMTARRWRGLVHYRLDDPAAWAAVREFEGKKK